LARGEHAVQRDAHDRAEAGGMGAMLIDRSGRVSSAAKMRSHRAARSPRW